MLVSVVRFLPLVRLLLSHSFLLGFIELLNVEFLLLLVAGLARRSICMV
jgi:hypothetical protein